MAAKRLIALLPTTLIGIISLLVYGNWPLAVLERLRTHPPHTESSVTLWNIAGVLSWLLWLLLPVCWYKLDNPKRFILILALTTLTMPYFQQSGLLALLVLPVGWLGWLTNVHYLLAITDMTVIFLIFPLVVLLWILHGQQNR